MERNQQQPPSQQMKLPESQMAAQHQHHQPPPPQKCPRCDSSNTKFCYYNNYSLSQPRYFCKACRRYWTHGGTLRNVPVGGGCRKSKRPKPSVPSSSGSEIGGRSQSSSPALPSQGFSGMDPGQVFRPFPPIISSMGNTHYPGGSFLSSLASMQSLPAGINQGAAVNLGSGNSQYSSNMALLQGGSLQSKTPPPQKFQVQHEYLPSQQGLSIPSRPLPSWTQSFINRGPAMSISPASPTFWSGSTADGDGGSFAGSSFNLNHWQDNNPGFDPSH